MSMMGNPERSDLALASARMDAVAFDGLFGWLHRPAAIGLDTGVVIVSPLGRDARCAHAPMRLFADELASAGFATLRYDQRGEGDSLDLPEPDADATPVWLADVRAAVDQLKASTGVKRVILAGVRIGATFAALAGDDADGLMLLAPVLNGRSWLQKMRFSGGSTSGSGDIDSGGLYLSPETAKGMAELDLNRRSPPPCPVLLAAQNKLVRTYGESLTAAGASATVTDFPGYDPLFIDAHSNEPPLDLFAAARTWLTDAFDSRPLGPCFRPIDAAPAELRPPGARERAIVFGPGLRGVLCTPEGQGPCDRALLFCNTGGDPRAGIGNFSTSAARAMAAQGVASLRFDFQGLGDSPIPLPALRSHVYETPREADLDAAVSLLADEGFSRIGVLGICAGAHHAFHLVCRDPRVSDAFAISLIKIVWREGDSMAVDRRDEGKSTQSYMSALRDPETYRRLLVGGIDVRTVARTLADRLKCRLQALMDRFVGRSPLTSLRQLSQRGGKVHLLMGTDDASLDEVETWFGPGGAGLTRLPGMSIEVDPRLDHGLARRASRTLALASLMAWLVG